MSLPFSPVFSGTKRLVMVVLQEERFWFASVHFSHMSVNSFLDTINYVWLLMGFDETLKNWLIIVFLMGFSEFGFLRLGPASILLHFLSCLHSIIVLTDFFVCETHIVPFVHR